MTKTNDLVAVTPGAGQDIATHLIDGKEHQSVVQSDASGHIVGSAPSYVWATPAAAVGASKVYGELFNGAAVVLEVVGIWAIPKLDVAVVGALGVRLDLFRTSAAATGGSVAAYKGAAVDPAGGNVNPLDTTNPDLPGGIVARWLPTGITVAHWLSPTYSLGEESATSMAYLTQHQNILPASRELQRLTLRQNEGLAIRQGPVAATGSIGFRVAVRVA